MSKPKHMKMADSPGKVKRPIPRAEPGIPSMPGGLSDDAKREWNQIVPVLFDQNLLIEADGPMLGVWCETYVIYKRATVDMHRDGHTIKVGNRPTINPAWKVSESASKKLLALETRFGMTPLSRAKILREH